MAAHAVVTGEGSVVDEPTPEELAALSAALDAATEAALRVVEAMERSSDLIQDCIHELRAANQTASSFATAKTPSKAELAAAAP